MIKYTNWYDYYTSLDAWLEEDLLSLDVINLMNRDTPEECLSTLKDNPNLVALTIDPITNQCLLLHHLTQIGGSINSREKMTVVMSGVGTNASLLRFKSLMDADFISEQFIPEARSLLGIKSISDFKILKNSKTTEIF